MKYFFLYLAIAVSSAANCQNVGINKPDPAHPLDVNGNMNVDGNILVNNIPGQAGQVLTTSSTGLTAWANLTDYKYVKSFTQDGTWVIPANVTRIVIEAWGSGGGGAPGGGGAGGMYIFSVQDVTPGSNLNVVIGLGGPHATCITCSAVDGTNTTVTGSFGVISALGGRGATAFSPGYASFYLTNVDKFIQFPGQNGFANTSGYFQKNATTFAVITTHGDGGAVGPDYTTRNQGQTVSVDESTGAQIEANFPTFAPFPGGGGGGGSLGRDGSKGMVVIRY